MLEANASRRRRAAIAPWRMARFECANRDVRVSDDNPVVLDADVGDRWIWGLQARDSTKRSVAPVRPDRDAAHEPLRAARRSSLGRMRR